MPTPLFLLFEAILFILRAIFLCTALAYLIMWPIAKMEDRKRIRQGYWVQIIHPVRLQAGHDDIAVVYHEGEKQHFFYGNARRWRKNDVVIIPNEENWSAQVPEWMRDNRTLILERMRKSLKRVEIWEATDRSTTRYQSPMSQTSESQ